VFERFTERARQVVVLAQDESRTLKHDYIGTEHILLGLLREQEGLAARLLGSFGVTIEEVRAQVVETVGEGEGDVKTGQIPFTPGAKKALELSLREALALGHSYIGTEHVLLGLVRAHRGLAARLLESFGADADTVRAETLQLLSGEAPPPHTAERRPMVLDGVDEWEALGISWGARQARLVRTIGLAAGAFPLGLLVGWLIWG